MTKRITIFRTRIDCVTKQQVFAQAHAFLRGSNTAQIATVNAEFLLRAREDTAFRDVLNACELNVPDTISLHLAFWKKGQIMSGRYPGIDLMWDLLRLAETQHQKVFLIAHQEGLSSWQETANALRQHIPTLQVTGTNLIPGDALSAHVCEKIAGSTMVFCNFGAPQQEHFLQQVKNATIPSVRIVMGVGGSFDFITGVLPRAPRWMRVSGLEWLYRFMKQPWRWRRMFRATIIFPLTVLFARS